MGYCPFSSLSHDTMDCIMTQGAGACCRWAIIRPEGPATLPHDTASKGHDTVGLRVGASDARGHMAWPWGESRYKNRTVAGGDYLCRNMVQQGCDTALRHGSSMLRHSRARAGSWALASQYNFVSHGGGGGGGGGGV